MILKILFNALKNKSFKYLFYKINRDVKENNNKLSKINLNKKYINETLTKYGYDYLERNLSYHYHLFAGLSKNSRNKKILEIGTHMGNFTNFLSKIFKYSKIYTCDLKSNSKTFKLNYEGKNKSFINNFIKIRNKNLNSKNIIFKEMNSFDLLKSFKKNYFDIIWLDGDHFDPQVTMDVISAFYLLKKKGILLCDDIFLDEKYSSNKGSDGLRPIEYLNKIKKIKTTYFVKRFTRINSYRKKYISYSIKI
jgi:predicted O-methyltransferase YrrM